MGIAAPFEPEKLICAVLYTDQAQADAALAVMREKYGDTDAVSSEYCFSDVSPYYDEEMHGRVYRRIVSFAACRDPQELAEIKAFTNSLEQQNAENLQRRFNLDPGFISPGRLSLATTKNAGHRIPLSDGIYAELTLFYARGKWNAFPWTYMDFQREDVQAFLSDVRKIYMQQRKDAAAQAKHWTELLEEGKQVGLSIITDDGIFYVLAVQKLDGRYLLYTDECPLNEAYFDRDTEHAVFYDDVSEMISQYIPRFGAKWEDLGVSKGQKFFNPLLYMNQESE